MIVILRDQVLRQNPSRFEKCVKSVEARGGSYSPRGVCAAAGRKKYGKRKFQAMAEAGRKAAKHNKRSFSRRPKKRKRR